MIKLIAPVVAPGKKERGNKRGEKERRLFYNIVIPIYYLWKEFNLPPFLFVLLWDSLISHPFCSHCCSSDSPIN